MRQATLLLMLVCVTASYAASAFLGVFVEGKPAYAVYNDEPQQGMTIASVSPGSPADRAGVREGDLMLSLGGKQTTSETVIASVMAEASPGDRVECMVWRDGAPLVLDVILADRRQSDEPVNKFSVRWSAAIALNARLEELTPQMRAFFGVESGVLVSHVEERGIADEGGLRAGDVLVQVAGQPVESVPDATARIFDASDSETVAITVNRKGETKTYDIPIDRANAWMQEFTLSYEGGETVVMFGPDVDDMPVVDMEMMDNWLRSVVPDYPGALNNDDLQARLEELEREMELWLREWESR